MRGIHYSALHHTFAQSIITINNHSIEKLENLFYKSTPVLKALIVGTVLRPPPKLFNSQQHKNCTYEQKIFRQSKSTDKTHSGHQSCDEVTFS
jgi:hypothetical protein